jgi:hypothetical protein
MIIRAGDLQATVTTQGQHGWCGLAQLVHRQYKKPWLLSPAFTLEHYIGVPLNAPEYIEYEPCASQKYLENISNQACTLHYEPLPCSQLSCRVTYQINPPHYVDIHVNMQTERSQWPLNSLALFFATIVRAPLYSGIHFLGEDLGVQTTPNTRWVHFNSFAAQIGNTVHPSGVPQPELPRPANPPPTYYYSDSSMRFDLPFFYAHVDNMAFVVMFQEVDREKIRFVVNPVAPAFGGPAWDFFWIIKEPMPGQRYELKFRSVFKPFVSAEDILEEFNFFQS